MTTISIRILRRLAGLALAFAGLLDRAAAQDYPTRPVRLIIPFAAGGVTDSGARIIAQRLSSSLGTVIIDNRGGGGSVIGMTAAATAEPDGYTLVFGGTGSVALVPAMQKGLHYDPIRSFAPVALVTSVPYLLVCHPSLPVRTVADLVAYAKANPGTVNFSGAAGAPSPMLAEYLKHLAGADLTVVRYKSGAAAITDVIGGQVQASFDSTTTSLPHIAEGKLRVLASATAERFPGLPQVPTLRESGYDIVANTWGGVLAPAGTPAPVIARLNSAINEALASDEVKAQLARIGSVETRGSPQDFARLIETEVARWSEIVRITGAKLE